LLFVKKIDGCVEVALPVLLGGAEKLDLDFIGKFAAARAAGKEEADQEKGRCAEWVLDLGIFDWRMAKSRPIGRWAVCMRMILRL
jgi:hypothetical protein